MSRQLARYLSLRASGCSIESAAHQSGIGLVEARLTEKAVEKGEVEMPTISEGETDMPEHDDAANEPDIELTADHLRGDVRDALLGWLKIIPKPWSALGEKEQRELADAADRFARSLVRQACQHIAANERPCIVAQLVEYKEKDGVEAKLKLPSKGEVVAALHEACGREVLLVTSGYDEFEGEAAPAEISADQPELGIGAEYENV